MELSRNISTNKKSDCTRPTTARKAVALVVVRRVIARNLSYFSQDLQILPASCTKMDIFSIKAF